MIGKNSQNIPSWIAFGVVLSVTLLLVGFYFYNLVEWRNYPDFGFAFRTATGIDSVGMVNRHGSNAGLKLGDQILTVNDRTFSTIGEFRTALRWELGDDNDYLLERQGKRLHVRILNIPVGMQSVVDRCGYLFTLGLATVILGILVFLMKKHERTSWIFFIFTSFLGLYCMFLSKIGRMSPYWLETVHLFVYIFTPALFLHLSFVFPEERPFLKKHPVLQLFPYIISAFLFAIIVRQVHEVTHIPPVMRTAVLVYLAAAVLYMIVSCLMSSTKSISEVARARAKILLLGIAIAYSLPILDSLTSNFFQIYLVPDTNYYVPFFFFFPLSITYAVIRYNLFEFDTVIRHAYGYALTTAALAAIYGVAVFSSNLALARFGVRESPVLPFIFFLVVIFIFNPIRTRLQRFLDRTFYRLEYDFQEVMLQISEVICTLKDLPQVAKAMMDMALGTMFIDSGALLLLNRERNGFEVYRHEDRRDAHVGSRAQPAQVSAPALLTIPAKEPFVQTLAEKRKIVSRYDVEEDPAFEGQRESGLRIFDGFGAQLIAPLIYEDSVKGLMTFGSKKSGKSYRQEDFRLLHTLTNQGAIAIENALLLQQVIEKERMEEELALARRIQKRMLPDQCPRITGFDIAALSLAAREVGGDFYDFIAMEGQKTGIIVGDVSGKGVSGALVMAAARSIFRMLSEESSDLGDIMRKANHRARRDIEEGIFVATLYAVADGASRTLRFVSAGQTVPVHVSSETGKAVLLETTGDNFPLGILAEANYEESLLPLKPGDRVILYTDGVVEALNDTGEMFGFERFLKAAGEVTGGTAETILSGLLGRLEQFVGAKPQHDDITLIVLLVTG